MNDRRVGKWVEIGWPWVAAAAAAAATPWVEARVGITSAAAATLLDKLVDFSSIGVGFWATALALLLALEGRETITALKKLEIYGRIVDYFLWSIYAFFALLVFCLVTIAVGRPHWIPHTVFAAIWAFLLAFTASAMLRSFRLLGKLLRSK